MFGTPGKNRGIDLTGVRNSLPEQLQQSWLSLS
jgi:hypothetical protein